MNRTHRDELVRWANSDEDTDVWTKKKGSSHKWKLSTGFTFWIKDDLHIVDDKYAKIRKQFIDEPSKIQYRVGKKWIPVSITSLRKFTNHLERKFKRYRIYKKEKKMSKKHKDEIIRWTESDEGTQVWALTYGEWLIFGNPTWRTSCTYVVDDKYAELRKQFISDSSKIQYRVDKKWIPITFTSLRKFTHHLERKFKSYRIDKKKPTYEWQWVGRSSTGDFYITRRYYTKEAYKVSSLVGLEKLEASKRIVNE